MCLKDIGLALLADDMCKQNAPSMYGSYKFDVTPITVCSGQPVPGTGTVTLTKKQTICCPP
jgi:hypothetical protein